MIRDRTGYGMTSVVVVMVLVRSMAIGEAWLGGLDLGRSERIDFSFGSRSIGKGRAFLFRILGSTEDFLNLLPDIRINGSFGIDFLELIAFQSKRAGGGTVRAASLLGRLEVRLHVRFVVAVWKLLLNH